MFATACGYTDIVKLLSANSGIDINIQNKVNI